MPERPAFRTSALTEICFQTSGHTALPVNWYRTGRQLELELQVVLHAMDRNFDRVISFAPTKHIYGYTFAHYLPEAQGIPVVEAWHDMLHVPQPRRHERLLLVCTSGCWRVIRDMLHRADSCDWVLLHSGGLLPSPALPCIADLVNRGANIREILGSTETGAVATRDNSVDSSVAWRIADDVTFINAESGPACPVIASPRIARRQDMEASPSTWRLPDLMEILPDGRHALHIGRESRFVKIAGRRCDLDEVEKKLREIDGISDVACIARTSPTRGEHYDVYFVVKAGCRSPDQVLRRINRICAAFSCAGEVKQVPQILRSGLGKILFAEMALTRISSTP